MRSTIGPAAGLVALAVVVGSLPPKADAQAVAQEPSAPRAAVTAGMGVSYAGLMGVLGELYLGHPKLSALVGAGGSMGNWTCQCGGVSLGLRGYTGGSKHRLYVDVATAYFAGRGDEERWVPAILAGYANVAPSGFTLNAALGLGRGVDRTIVPAVNIGFGYTWGGHPPTEVAAQTPQPGLSFPSPPAAWAPSPDAPFSPHVHAARSAPYQSQPTRSEKRTIVTHALVGTGAGLLSGLVLSGTNVSDDDTSVVLVRTYVGLVAGVTSGLVTWLLERGN